MNAKQREKAVDLIKLEFSTISRCSWFLLLLTFISASTLSGCSPAQFKTKAAQVTQLVFTAPSGPQTFNLTQNHSAYSVFGYIYDGLVTENGLTGEVEPALAESWEISPDKKRIVFTLREGLKWSDGEPLTIDDVLFSYQDIYFNEKIPTDIRDGLRIGTNRALPTVEKLDQRRIEFAVPEPFDPFLRFVGGLSILPAHALREAVQTTGTAGSPKFISTWGTGTKPKEIISNGPYRIESYAPSQRVIFQRNPYYWRKDAQGHPEPYIERIVLLKNSCHSFIW